MFPHKYAENIKHTLTGEEPYMVISAQCTNGVSEFKHHMDFNQPISTDPYVTAPAFVAFDQSAETRCEFDFLLFPNPGKKTIFGRSLSKMSV